MRRVILESPYVGTGPRNDATIKINVSYARKCLADCITRGESPYASHLLLPEICNDGIPAERIAGIAAGHEWTKIADAVVVYTDLGISPGMQQGIDAATAANVPVEYRAIGFSPMPTWSKCYGKVFQSADEISLIMRESRLAHFVDCDFSKLDLRALSFDNCIFDACKMVRTKLGSAVRAQFYSVDMRHIDLTWADLRWTYAINCAADHAKMIGCQFTLDCDFMAGLIAREEDGWRLIRWAALVASPAADLVRSLIPKRYHLLLKLQDEQPQPRTRLTPELDRSRYNKHG